MTQRDKFNQWLGTDHGREVYRLFATFAASWRSAGHDRCAFALILNRVRWEMSVASPFLGDGFKISNSYGPLLARHLALSDPSYRRFFRFHGDRDEEQMLAA